MPRIRVDLNGNIMGRQWKKKLKWVAFALAFLSLGAFGTTLSANISLNNGANVEFGQGVSLYTACDSSMTFTPVSQFVNGTPGSFLFTSINITNLDTTDRAGNSEGCANTNFTIKFYKENGDMITPVVTFAVLTNGSLISESGQITTQNGATESTSGQLVFAAPSVLASDVYRLVIESRKGIPCYGTDSSSIDGLSECTAAPSGYWLAQHFPSYPSGFYWIRSNAMPNALEMYVDMTEEGGGYDFYFITNGPNVNYVTDNNGGTPLGLDLVMPRSKEHWRAMMKAVRDHRPSGNFYDYFQTAYGIYRSDAGTRNGDYTNLAMNSSTASPDWRVKDGGRWWLSDTPYSEPNGDYVLNAFLSGVTISENYNFEPFDFNDMDNAFWTGSYYLVSTNAKP